MKIAKSAYSNNNNGPSPKKEAILPLIPEEVSDEELDQAKKATFKLRSVPTDATSGKYTFIVPILDGTDTVRRTLQWREKLEKVFRGLALQTFEARHNLIQELCRGTPLTAYQRGVQESITYNHAQLAVTARNAVVRDPAHTDAEHAAAQQRAADVVPVPALRNEDVLAGIAEVVRAQAPYKALEKQKRSMRRDMRKPANMKIRTYVNHMIRINQDELPHLPPFRANQQLTPDELTDIVCFGLPKSWIRKMDEHNFDPLEHDIMQVVAFGERMEAAEDFDPNAERKPAANNGKKPSKKHKTVRNNGGDKWCHFHETDTHNTAECETLKRLKEKGDNKPSRNKTWRRKSDDAKTLTKKELAAIARKAGEKAIKAAQECNHVAKRKSDSEDDGSEASDTQSLNAVDQQLAQEMESVDQQLAAFDFNKETQLEGDEISC